MKDKFINYTKHMNPNIFANNGINIEIDNFLRNPNQTRINENENEMNKNNEININQFNQFNKPENKTCENKESENKNVEQFLNNNLRLGSCTRLSNDTFKKDKESYVVDRFQYLTRNYQDPDKLLLPFPRGGEGTRKVKKSGAVIE
jgi:hypothetical protein